MCFVKDLFWEPEETVVQLHPPASRYVNNAPYCLHLWRNSREEMKLPPAIMVGIKDLGELTEAERRYVAESIWQRKA